MRRAAWIAALGLLLAPPLWAQETEGEDEPEERQEQETLLSGGIDSGGFGALVFRFGEVADQFATFGGIRGGWIINHQFSIGLGGYGLGSEICLDDDRDCFLRELEFGYGGFEFEYIGMWNRVVHYNAHLLIGGGGVTFFNFATDGVFVAEPVVNLELNVAKWFRINAGAGYRIVAGVDIGALDNGDLSGFFGNLAFKFGSF